MSVAASEEILSAQAVAFVERLHRELNPRRLELLDRRRERQLELDRGALPDFRADTRAIREGDWRVAPAPDDLLDVGSSRVDLQACKLEYSIVSPK